MKQSMHETTDTLATCLFPPPLSDISAEISGADDLISMHGWCAPFCDSEGPANGTSIEDHGTSCESRPIGAVHCVDKANQSDAIYLALHEHYTHGVYSAPLLEGSRTGYARLHFGSVEEDDGLDGLYLTSGEVRVLAAQLVAAADILDKIGQRVGKGRYAR